MLSSGSTCWTKVRTKVILSKQNYLLKNDYGTAPKIDEKSRLHVSKVKLQWIQTYNFMKARKKLKSNLSPYEEIQSSVIPFIIGM